MPKSKALEALKPRCLSSYLLIVLCLSFSACSGKSVVTVPTESEAIEILDVFQENEIPAEIKQVGDEKTKSYSIIVNEDFLGGSNNQSIAIQVLSDNCLPHRDPPIIEEGGLIASVEAEKAKAQRQVKINIIGLLRRFRDATCVDVTYVPPQDQLASITPYPATASVVIGYKSSEPGFTDTEIRNLVSGSVPNLQPDKVNVKLAYRPVRPIVRPVRNGINKVLLIGGAGLTVILGSVLLIYFMQRRKTKTTSTALAIIDDDENDQNETTKAS